MVDPVEELLQVDIDHPPVALLQPLSCLLDGLMGAPTRPEPVAVLRERRVEDGLEHLRDGLLDQPVQHRGDPQQPHTTIGLRDLDPPDG